MVGVSTIYRLVLVKPELNDYWYEKQCLEDPDTMSYNAGYDVSYEGYHYDTGCIDFPEERWEACYQRREKEHRVFLFLKDIHKDCYVGYVNYQYQQDQQQYHCGIVIEAKYRGMGYAKEGLTLLCEYAFSHGVDALYDGFEEDRASARHVFQELGFEIAERTTWNRFGTKVNGMTIVLTKDKFQKRGNR